MSIISLFKSSKNVNYKDVLKGEIGSFKREYPNLPIYDLIMSRINNFSVEQFNDYFNSNTQVSPKAYAEGMIVNALNDCLSTGQYHVYGGVLNFQGEEMYGLTVRLLEKKRAEGELTEDDVYNSLRIIRENIKSAG